MHGHVAPLIVLAHVSGGPAGVHPWSYPKDPGRERAETGVAQVAVSVPVPTDWPSTTSPCAGPGRWGAALPGRSRGRRRRPGRGGSCAALV
jgi:hypothetical protein